MRPLGSCNVQPALIPGVLTGFAFLAKRYAVLVVFTVIRSIAVFITECGFVSGIVLDLGTREVNEIDKKHVLTDMLDVTPTVWLVGECCGPSRRELESPGWPGKILPQRQPVLTGTQKQRRGKGMWSAPGVTSGHGAVGGGERTEGRVATRSGRGPCWLVGQACEWNGAALGAFPRRSNVTRTGCSAAEEQKARQEAAAVSQVPTWRARSSWGEGSKSVPLQVGAGGLWRWEV